MAQLTTETFPESTIGRRKARASYLTHWAETPLPAGSNEEDDSLPPRGTQTSLTSNLYNVAATPYYNELWLGEQRSVPIACGE